MSSSSGSCFCKSCSSRIGSYCFSMINSSCSYFSTKSSSSINRSSFRTSSSSSNSSSISGALVILMLHMPVLRSIKQVTPQRLLNEEGSTINLAFEMQAIRVHPIFWYPDLSPCTTTITSRNSNNSTTMHNSPARTRPSTASRRNCRPSGGSRLHNAS